MKEEEISYTPNNTHIKDSYRIKNIQIMKEYIYWIIEVRKSMKYPVTRSPESYLREWIGHNRLYEKGWFISHTKSVDLNENNSILEELIWHIIGSDKK